MSFGIANFDSLPDNVKLAFEDLEAWANAFLLKEHNPDGTHKAAGAQVDHTLTAAEQVEESHHWYRGPWTFDLIGQSSGLIALRPGEIASGTYNNFSTSGLDNAVIVELNPLGGGLTLTGLRQDVNIKRLLVLGNYEAGAHTITLKHENTGSTARYRFSLPSATDVVLAAGQFIWLFYSPEIQRWRAFITGQQSGNLALASGAVSVATIALSQAQIEALGTTDVEIVAAPGSGLILIPDTLSVEIDTTTAYAASGTWRTKYGTSAWDGFALHDAITADLNNVRKKLFIRPPAVNSFAAGYGTRDPRNKAIVLEAVADPTGGGAATATVTLIYHTVSALA